MKFLKEAIPANKEWLRQKINNLDDLALSSVNGFNKKLRDMGVEDTIENHSIRYRKELANKIDKENKPNRKVVRNILKQKDLKYDNEEDLKKTIKNEKQFVELDEKMNKPQTFSQWYDKNHDYRDEEYRTFDGYVKKFDNVEVLRNATASDIIKNAHKFYEVYPVDSEDREDAFNFAEEELGIKYEDLYQAWLKEKPINLSLYETIDNNKIKKYLIISPFSPFRTYRIKNIPNDSWLWDSDYRIVDVSNKTGRHLIKYNKEEIFISSLQGKSISQWDKEIFQDISNYVKQNPDDYGWYEEHNKFPVSISTNVKDFYPFISEYKTWLGDLLKYSYVTSDFEGDFAYEHIILNFNDNQFRDYTKSSLSQGEEDLYEP